MPTEFREVAERLEKKLDDIHENIGGLRSEVKTLGSKYQLVSVITSAMIATMVSIISKIIPGFGGHA